VNRPTVGKYISDTAHQAPDSRDPTEIRNVIRSDQSYQDGLEDACHAFINKHRHRGDFFVSVLTKQERVLLNRVTRHYYIGRFTCPTPNYDTAAWKFNAKLRKCELVYQIGDKNSTIDMVRFPQFYAQLQPELLRYALMFQSGELMRMTKELNGEHALIVSPYEVMKQIPLIL
jgi:hypothetical protein